MRSMQTPVRRKLMTRYKEEEYKPRGRAYGAFYTQFDGIGDRRFYLAFRRPKDVFRDGLKTRSEAFRTGRAVWAIDDDTLREVRRRGVRVLGVFNHVHGDCYWTTIPHYFDTRVAPPKDFEAQGGSNQRFMPINLFKRAGFWKKDGRIWHYVNLPRAWSGSEADCEDDD